MRDSAREDIAEPLILRLPEIRRALAGFDPLPAMEAAFRAYSEGRAVVAPVGELLFEQPAGDAHIKCGYIRGGAHFVVKVATGFYENAARGRPPNSGAVLLFTQDAGLPAAVLLDEGWLTNLRTAAAGAVAAKHLAPRQVQAIGVLGTGVQARLQVELLQSVTPCRRVVVWGRRESSRQAYREEMAAKGYQVVMTEDPREVAHRCNLIITATPSAAPLLDAAQIAPGTHITAVGADTTEKNELDPGVLAKADIVVADSLEQCRERGEIYRALKAGRIACEKPVELGRVIADPTLRRQSEEQISIADLTGVAVQDVMVAEAVLEAVRARSP